MKKLSVLFSLFFLPLLFAFSSGGSSSLAAETMPPLPSSQHITMAPSASTSILIAETMPPLPAINSTMTNDTLA